MLCDQLGRVHSRDIPSRVLSLVPSWTDFVATIIDHERIVGRTDYCVEPPEILTIPPIGGTKNPNISQIVEMKPDLVIANKEENKQVDINRLRAHHLEVMVTGAITIPQALEEMHGVEIKLTGSHTLSSQVAQRINNWTPGPPFTFVYLIWSDPLMAAGERTYISHTISTAGGTNLISRGDGDRYPQISKQMLQELEPDFVFLPDEPFEFTSTHQDEFTNLLETSTVLLVDGKLASWYGTRMVDALQYYGKLWEMTGHMYKSKRN